MIGDRSIPVLTACVLLVLAGCGSDAPTESDDVSQESTRGFRYCEILLVQEQDGSLDAEIWGTQGLNACPSASWDELEAARIQEEYGVLAVKMNGPRYGLPDVGGFVSVPDGPVRTYGRLEMRRIAAVTLAPGQSAVEPYTDSTVERDTEFEFRAGSEVYELLSTDGSVYIMQSYSQIIDPELGEADLPLLGTRLELPPGWTFRARTLEEDLVLRSAGQAVVLQDELENTYMRYVDGAEVLTTAAGIAFVRTPDERFADLPDWPYAARYVEIDGLRQAYVEAGPSGGETVLLLHGQPSWSYLYRKMIPVLADAGYRTIAMDHLGMGRSDKPIDFDAYSYLGHIERLEAFIEALGLRDITLFVQDWGSLIGLHVAGENPEWFARLSVGNGILPVIPAGAVPFPPVENPDEIDASLASPFGLLPAQQPAFYDGCERLSPLEPYFGDWITFAMKSPNFRAGEVVEAMTYFDLPDAEEAAYDAPYPSRIYMTGARTFPSLINDVPGTNDAAWDGLTAYEKPFITIWASNDPGNQGGCEAQQSLIDNVPGAAGQAHTRLPESSHFLQDDQGEEIARRLVQFMADNPLE